MQLIWIPTVPNLITVTSVTNIQRFVSEISQDKWSPIVCIVLISSRPLLYCYWYWNEKNDKWEWEGNHLNQKLDFWVEKWPKFTQNTFFFIFLRKFSPKWKWPNENVMLYNEAGYDLSFVFPKNNNGRKNRIIPKCHESWHVGLFHCLVHLSREHLKKKSKNETQNIAVWTDIHLHIQYARRAHVTYSRFN